VIQILNPDLTPLDADTSPATYLDHALNRRRHGLD
jgi:hypothetical protein